jgi:hypothetical protein
VWSKACSCRILLPLILYLLVGGVESTVSGQQGQLLAPTYYIAARVTYDGRPEQLYVVGASNLPFGARLDLQVYRHIGEGGDVISEDATAVVGKGGFFDATLHPLKGNRFEHNLVCQIVFATYAVPPQPPSVLRIVGSRGEHLGFPKNPQVEVVSGERFLLSDLVHVP